MAEMKKFAEYQQKNKNLFLREKNTNPQEKKRNLFEF